MRHLLIIDDEPNIVEGLSHTMWEHFGDDIDVSKAYNGNSALEILSKSPIDLVITDIRMPGISGLDLIQQIHDRRINCRVLILTGYDDFTVIQQAMRKPNLVDFLLKTEGDEMVIKAVQRAFLAIAEEEQKQKMLALAESHTKALDALRREQWLWYLLGISPAGQTAETSGIAPILAIDETKPSLLMFARIFAERTDLNVMSWLQGMMNLILKTHFNFEMTIIGQNDAVWILQMSEGHEGNFPFASRAELSQHLRTSIYEAQSRLSDEEIEMSAAFHSEWVDPMDWAACIRKLSRIIESLTDNGRRQQVVDTAVDEKAELKKNIMVDSKEADVVKAVHKYIEKHLGDHSLSLTDIAAANHYNPSYLSRLYKKVTGAGLIDKINDIRINRACELLKSSNLKINEISEKVGYASPSYFTLYFRKRIGMTPKEYRDNAE
jgi:two-component system response regulator YesN